MNCFRDRKKICALTANTNQLFDLLGCSIEGVGGHVSMLIFPRSQLGEYSALVQQSIDSADAVLLCTSAVNICKSRTRGWRQHAAVLVWIVIRLWRFAKKPEGYRQGSTSSELQLPGQVVIAGAYEGVNKAIAELKAAGANVLCRCLSVALSIAPWWSGCDNCSELDRLLLATLRCLFVANVTAQPKPIGYD